MTAKTTLRIEVERPEVSDDTVWFRWTSNPATPSPPKGGLFYRYNGLDITPLSDVLWMEVFLALRLGSISRLADHVEIHLPEAVPQNAVDYWRTYHHNANVTISPISERDDYSPWRTGEAYAPDACYESAVFYGGGRESLATACMLGEIFGRERILLIQCVDPHFGDEERREVVTSRFDRFSLGPAGSELGFATQRVTTNLHAIAIREGGKSNEPHLQQYTAGLLPVLLLRRARRSTPGYAWVEFVIARTEDGRLRFRYPRSRPEVLAAESRHRRRVSGIDHEYLNVCMAITEMIAFRLLAFRYKDAFPYILTCTDALPDQRWCQNCRRCYRYAWHCLHEQVAPTALDLDLVLGEGRWTQRLVDEISSWEVPPPGQNSPYSRRLCGPFAFGQNCDSLHQADPAWVQATLGTDAWFNALMIQAHYGNRAYPAYLESPAQAYDWMPPEISDSLRRIVGKHARVTPKLTPPLVGGDNEVEGPFARPFEHRLLALPHVQP